MITSTLKPTSLSPGHNIDLLLREKCKEGKLILCESNEEGIKYENNTMHTEVDQRVEN